MAYTFLMTDIEGSALLWDEDARSMSAALADHDRVVEQTVGSCSGRLIKSRGEGDATMSVFDHARDAASAAIALQRRLLRYQWPTSRPIRVRIALDTGEAEARADDFFGPVLNRCARLRSAGHGGQILVSSAAAEELIAAAISDVTVTDLGAFRLKGLKEAERVYQLAADDLPNEFEPLRALDVRLHNLPEEKTSFVGRETETAEALARLRSHRLVTIWGPGGVGKTHLALRVAALLVDELKDGAWWVDLVGVSELDLVADHVAHVLGVGDPKTLHTMDDVCDLLRPRNLLLMLDNCEHLLEPLAELVSRLLERCSNIQILATSRERLGVPGEALLPLGGLALPRGVTRPADALDAPAIRLFLDRARDVGANVDASEMSDLKLVEGVCRRLEGLPLAIELAAAGLATMGLPALAEEMHARLDVLDAAPRRGHAARGRRTIRETIEWSISRATEEEQRALVACTVFTGSFSLDAARIVGDCRVSVLLRLVEQSLISRDAAANRYRLLEPVRQFAGEVARLEDALHVAEDRFLTWLVAQTQPPDPPPQEWLDLIESELDNIRGGLSVASRKSAPALCEIVVNLTSYWWVRGPMAEGRAWLETALAQCDRSWLRLRARLGAAHGFLTYWLGDYEASSRSCEEALRLARVLGDRALEARILTAFGLVTEALGDLPVAQDRYQHAVARAREAHEPRLEANALSNLGVVASLQGDLETARAHYEASLRIREAIGDLHGATISLYNLGEVAEALGETADATSLWRKCFENWLTLKDRYRAAATLRSFALMHSAQDPERAAVGLGAAESAIQVLAPHEPASALLPRLARRADECRATLGEERYGQLQAKGAAMSLEEAARFAGLVR